MQNFSILTFNFLLMKIVFIDINSGEVPKMKRKRDNGYCKNCANSTSVENCRHFLAPQMHFAMQFGRAGGGGGNTLS